MEVKKLGIIGLISLICLMFAPGCKKSVENQNLLAGGYFGKAQSFFKIEDETGKLISNLEENKKLKDKWLKAFIEYKKIADECPDSKYVLDSLASMIKIKQRYGSYKEYIPFYHRIIKDFPESQFVKEGKDVISKLVERLMISADDYAYMGQHSFAVDEYKNVLFVNPEFEQANYKLGLVYEKMGLYKQAEQEWKKADKLPESHYTLGLAYYSKTKFDKAIEEFEKAINIKPNYSPAYMNLALTYEKIDDKTKAKEMWRKYLDIASKDQNEGKWILTAEEHLK